VTATVLGGYDDNLTAGLGSGSGVAPAPMASGSTGSVDAVFGYFRGNALRSISMDSTGNLMAYPGYLDHPAAGASATVGGRTVAGRDLTLGASERVGYEPLFNTYSAQATSGMLPPGMADAVRTTGLYYRRALSSYTSVSADRRWSRSDRTTLSYSFNAQHFVDNAYGDSRAHNVGAEQRRRVGHGVGLRAGYNYVDQRYTNYGGGWWPIRQHRIEGGPEIETGTSHRRLTLSLGAGAGYAESFAPTGSSIYHSWVPVGSASLKLAVSQTSSVEGGYRRDFWLFSGVTNDLYTSDRAFLTAGGLVARHADLRVGASFDSSRTALTLGAHDTFRVYGTSVQLRVPVSSTLSAFGAYYFYRQNYSNPGALPKGFPAEYDRHAFRVGLTVSWVPLPGALSPPPVTPR
jgi:hypothetical protein